MRNEESFEAMDLLLFLFSMASTFCSSYAEQSPVDVSVGVLLYESRQQQRSVACLNMAISDFYSKHPNYTTRIVFHRKDSTGKPVPAAARAAQLISTEGVQAIIGPPTSMQAPFVISLGEEARVPIITFSATNPALTSVRRPYFFRATQNDSTQTGAISALMQAFGWRQAVPIYVDNEFGLGILRYLADALVGINAFIPYRCGISENANNNQIRAELLNLRNMSTRVFVVHVEPDLGGKIFEMARSLGMMGEEYVWIITDAFTSAFLSLKSSVIDSMKGVIGVRPFVNVSKMRDSGLNVYDLWGYDTAIALAMAVEKVGSERFKNKTTKTPSSDIEHLPVSANGPLLLDALSKVSFEGLMGHFEFVDGEIPPAIYEIVNINGAGVGTVGFWTRDNGLAKELPMNSSHYGIKPSSLQSIIWPGNPKSTPKGWILPIEGKKLKILIPKKKENDEFVTFKTDPTNKITWASGYCIKIFEDVVKKLDYALPYEFIPYILPNGSSAGSYNNMLEEVYKQNYDAAVGDITIIDFRSEWGDFTMPYTVSGVSLLVRASYGRSDNPMIFFSPFSKSLWIACLLSFPFIALVIWVLESNIISSFTGNLAQQIGQPLGSSFLRVISPRGDNLGSNSRIVFVVWSFAIMILIQSYTASLASLLTVQRLHPISVDVTELSRSNQTVGYPADSFVLDMLLKLGFKKDQLQAFDSLEECHTFFNNGTVVAAFEETPYLQKFLPDHRDQYRTKHAFETGGFGFVFQKGSPLTNDVSRKILQVVTNNSRSDSEKRLQISREECSVSSVVWDSSTLQLKSFKPLFYLVVGTALLAVSFSSTLQMVHYVLRLRKPPLQVDHINLDLDPHINTEHVQYL